MSAFCHHDSFMSVTSVTVLRDYVDLLFLLGSPLRLAAHTTQ